MSDLVLPPTHGLMKIKVVKLPNYPADVPLPNFATSGAAAVDLIAAIPSPYTMWGTDKFQVPTGLRMEIPHGYFGAIVPRGGLGTQGLIVANIIGVIDSDFRGEVVVTLKNLGWKEHVITPGMRIAQMLIMRHEIFEFIESEEISDTQRGSGMHGSTGV